MPYKYTDNQFNEQSFTNSLLTDEESKAQEEVIHIKATEPMARMKTTPSTPTLLILTYSNKTYKGK